MKCNSLFRHVLVVAIVGFVASLLFLTSLRNGNMLSQISTWTQRERNVEDKPFQYSTNSTPSSPLTTQVKQETLEELTLLLKERLSLPNNATKMIYSKSCAASPKGYGCTDLSCKHQISSSPEERLRNVMASSHLRLSDANRDLIRSIGQSIPENDVIFVSASSSNHFHEMQAMFHNLHTKVLPHVKNASVVLFDIGLSAGQRNLTEEKCKCQVLTFPKEKFPKHVSDNHCYSWKPIIIMAAITKARKLLVYQDSSIRWSPEFQVIFDRAEKYGHQIVRPKFFIPAALHTMTQTFNFLKEEACTYMPYPEIAAGIQIHKKDPLVIQAVIEPYAKCALEADCICPVEPMSIMHCKKRTTFYMCHRFDQSAITIMLAKLYGEDMYKLVVPKYSQSYISVMRNHVMPSYFKEGS